MSLASLTSAITTWSIWMTKTSLWGRFTQLNHHRCEAQPLKSHHTSPCRANQKSFKTHRCASSKSTKMICQIRRHLKRLSTGFHWLQARAVRVIALCLVQEKTRIGTRSTRWLLRTRDQQSLTPLKTWTILSGTIIVYQQCLTHWKRCSFLSKSISQ